LVDRKPLQYWPSAIYLNVLKNFEQSEEIKLLALKLFAMVSREDCFMKGKTYRLCVCGSRHFDNYDLLCRKLDKLTEKIKEKRKIVVVTGAGAGIVIGNRKRRGADALAEKWAYERRYSLLRFHADWNKHGKAAGPIRNSEMIQKGQPDAVIAFWDGESKGTKDAIDKAEAEGITTRIVRIEK
jgi:hypothetical protein